MIDLRVHGQFCMNLGPQLAMSCTGPLAQWPPPTWWGGRQGSRVGGKGSNLAFHQNATFLWFVSKKIQAGVLCTHLIRWWFSPLQLIPEPP